MGSRIKLKFDEFRLNTNSADYCTGAHLELRDDYMGAGTNFKICKNSPGKCCKSSFYSKPAETFKCLI